MRNISYILAVLAIGAAAYFGWTTKQKFEEQIASRDKLMLENKNLEGNIAEKENSKTTTTNELGVAQEEESTAKANLEKAKSDIVVNGRTLDDIKGQLEEAQAEQDKIDGAVASLEALFPGTKLEDVPKLVEGLEGDNKRLTDDLAQLERERTRLKERVAKLKADIVRVQGKIDESKARVRNNTFQARIISVDSRYGILQIAAGEKSGLTDDARLLVRRGGRLVGKVEVERLEASSTIAKIVPGSMRAGAVLQAGDQVILEKTNAN